MRVVRWWLSGNRGEEEEEEEEKTRNWMRHGSGRRGSGDDEMGLRAEVSHVTIPATSMVITWKRMGR